MPPNWVVSKIDIGCDSPLSPVLHIPKVFASKEVDPMTAIISIGSDGTSAGLTECSVVPDSAVISGAANELGENHFATNNGKLTIGTWECTPYAEDLSCSDYSEFATILSGRVALTDPDGTVNTFGPGESYIMPVGWQGRFEVLETLRKIYVIASA